VVTLLVNPEQSERLALASTEGKIQLALRNPMDQTSPETPGVKTAALVGVARAQAPKQVASSRPRSSKAPAAPMTMSQPVPEPMPTVEVIRGDKRVQEVIK